MKQLLFSTLLFCLFACSSAENGTYKKSSEIQNNLKENIPTPWGEISAEGSDFALENKNTKSFFLFNSACRKYEGSNLNTLTSSMLSGLENVKIIEKKNSFYQQRDAAEVLASGRLDGIERFFKIITIQKNSCIYDYVLIATNKHTLESDSPALQIFLQRIILK
jgi:hypothetical protein